MKQKYLVTADALTRLLEIAIEAGKALEAVSIVKSGEVFSVPAGSVLTVPGAVDEPIPPAKPE